MAVRAVIGLSDIASESAVGIACANLEGGDDGTRRDIRHIKVDTRPAAESGENEVVSGVGLHRNRAQY